MDHESTNGSSSENGEGTSRQRLSTVQTEQLEAMCQRPNATIRAELSKNLDLDMSQIKFWFQNRRSQDMNDYKRSQTSKIRLEIGQILLENKHMTDVAQQLICPCCGFPPVDCTSSEVDEYSLSMENEELRRELERVSRITSNFTQQKPPTSVNLSGLDVTPTAPVNGPYFDQGTFSSINPTLPLQPVESNVSDITRLMMDIATNAMDELLRIVRNNFWIKSAIGSGDTLIPDIYGMTYPMTHLLNNPNVYVEGTRDSGVVTMNCLQLVEMLLDSSKLMQAFPTIISEAKVIQELSSCSMSGSPDGVLLLMYEVLQPLSPLVLSREFYFLRYCVQIKPRLWVITNVACDLSQENRLISPSDSRKLPSGCLIKEMPNGHSKVIWVEHAEIVEKAPIHPLFNDKVYSGMAFGAARWLASLQRQSERYQYLFAAVTDTSDGCGVASPIGKQSLMRFSSNMLKKFCENIRASPGGYWTTFYDTNDVAIRLKTKGTDGNVLLVVTSIRLPLSSETLFKFFRDGANGLRLLCDAVTNDDVLQEATHIQIGSQPGNFISVFQHHSNETKNKSLVLQENWDDRSGSLVVYTLLELHSMNKILNGEDTWNIQLHPCGIIIIPDGQQENRETSTSEGVRSNSCGSLLTISYQIPLSNVENVNFDDETVATAHNLINGCVERIKVALNLTST
ncbi:hypothetical protein GIB67_005219 [Kingdonia uniflora]|uniref:Uncharacterized protein n=1 Tax=Kingdonia uniflora TaxID=39325 RepID=A0A7J7NN05_9MAGN|nr:hypothetical protein GIB67_005219 [Kingdonia uniflora]